MRIFFWLVVLTGFLVLTHPVLAQDSLLYTTTTQLTLKPSTIIDASSALKWRLSGTLGYHRLLQNKPSNESLFLASGLQATLAADYFIGNNWGLGVQVGYQSLAVNDDSLRKQRGKVIPLNSFLMPTTALHSFMLTAGPVFSFPISERVTLDFNARVGGFYTDAPVIKAFFEGTNLPALTITPSDQRFGFGANGSVGLKYQFTQQLALGVSGTVSHTSFKYMQISPTSYNQYRVSLTTYGVQATLSYRFVTKQRQTTVAIPAAVPKPVCYPPVLDTSQPTEYEIGNERPVIRWRSSAPIYTEGERYVFRLYTLPGNRLLYERTVQEPQLSWPAQLTLPDTASYYFYSIYTSRSDDQEQTCRSEPVVGAFGFFSRQMTEPARRVTSREPTHAFILRLYELRPTLVYEKAVVSLIPTTPAKHSTKATRPTRSRSGRTTKLPITPLPVDTVRTDSIRLGTIQADSVRARLASSDSIKTDSARVRIASSDSAKTDSMVLSMKIVPTLLHEEPIHQPGFIWPSNVVLPSQPTVYQYTISRNNTQELIQSYYLMVEPDGCSQVINEAMKNKYLRNSISSTKPVQETAQPANKGQP